MAADNSLDRLSDSLLRDERILSAPEKELLAKLLQRARIQPDIAGNSVAQAIAGLAGEIIAQRACGALSDRVSQRLLTQQFASPSGSSKEPIEAMQAGTPPSGTPPSPSDPMAPRPPSPSPPSGGKAIKANGTAVLKSSDSYLAGTPPSGTPPSPSDPMAPRPPSPSPPSGGIAAETAETSGRGVPEIMPAECIVLDEFLSPAELNALRQYTLEREMEFQVSEVISPGVGGSLVDYEHRRSRVLMELGKFKDLILDRLSAPLARSLRRLGREPFTISRVEAQITASNHGDYFRWHNDDGAPETASREITFVYFFHGEPKQFSGGELRIYDSRWKNNTYVPLENYRTIVPEQNQLVLFASSLAHEIRPIECSSKAFVDSRFTVNGWLHR